MTARETYLDVIKEQHIRSVIDMCLDKYDIYQTNEQILNSVFELDVNPDAKIEFASPFKNWTASQMVNYILLVAGDSMAITTNALDDRPKNYKGEENVKTG